MNMKEQCYAIMHAGSMDSWEQTASRVNFVILRLHVNINLLVITNLNHNTNPNPILNQT